MQTDESILERRFHTVRGEISSLQRKIHKVGLFFHKYSLNDLHDMRDRIDSMVQKIGEDVTNWYEQGKFAKKSMDMYHRHRKAVEIECDRVEEEIKNRPPTLLEEFWENVKEGFRNFARKIMDKLPELVEGLLTKIGRRLLERIFRPQIPGPRR